MLNVLPGKVFMYYISDVYDGIYIYRTLFHVTRYRIQHDDKIVEICQIIDLTYKLWGIFVSKFVVAHLSIQ